VDVGAKVKIYRLLASLLARDAGVIMVSSYLPEVNRPSDTLHVFRAGGLAASHGHKDATQETILNEAISVWCAAESSGNDGSDHSNHVSG
jgi:ribose transport system ATP-binding protein